MRGVMYQMKLLTWVTWRLMCQKNASIGNWWLATEVANARGFHDLVLKYAPSTPNEDGKYMYRFVQIKHRTSLKRNATINSFHLTSKNKVHRQGSLFYLFKSYLDMLGNFEKITPDQIVDLTVFTNMNIEGFKFLVPVENDKLYGFEGRGKRYRIDIRVLRKMEGVMIGLYGIKDKWRKGMDETIIVGFLRKLVFLVDQPSESQLEELIVNEMGKTFNAPEIFYDNLNKNIINWFLVYDEGKAPYLTEAHVMNYLKHTQDMLWKAKKAETFVDPISKMSDKFKMLSL